MKRTALLLTSVIFLLAFTLSVGAQRATVRAAGETPEISVRPAVRTSAVRSTRLYIKTVPQGASIEIKKLKKKGKSGQLITIPENLIPKGATSVELTVKAFFDVQRSKQKRIKITRGRIKRVEFRFDDKEGSKASVVPVSPRSPRWVSASGPQTVSPYPAPPALYTQPPLPVPYPATPLPSLPMVSPQKALPTYPGITTVWERRMTPSGKVEKIIGDPDGGFLVLSRRYSVLRQKLLFCFTHYNANGKIDWQKDNIIDKTACIRFASCLRTPAGNYFFCGNEFDKSLKTAVKAMQSSKPFAILLSPQGKVIPWEHDPFEKCKRSIVGTATLLPDGSFLFGSVKIPDPQKKPQPPDLAILYYHVDAKGKLLGEKPFDLPRGSFPWALLACRDGGYFLLGANTKVDSDHDLIMASSWLCRFGEDRELLWDIDMGGKDGYSPRAAQTSGGEFLTIKSVSDSKGYDPFLANSKYQIIRVDSSGEKKVLPIDPNTFFLDTDEWILTSTGKILTVGWSKKQNETGNFSPDLSSGGSLCVLDAQTGKCLGKSLPNKIKNASCIVSLGNGEYLIASNDASSGTPSMKFKNSKATLFKIRLEEEKLPKTEGVSNASKKPNPAAVKVITSKTLEQLKDISKAKGIETKIPPVAVLPASKKALPLYSGVTTVWEKELTSSDKIEKMIADPDGGYLILFRRHSRLQQKRSILSLPLQRGWEDGLAKGKWHKISNTKEQKEDEPYHRFSDQ